MLSPPCQVFSDLQRLFNFKRMTQEQVATKLEAGMVHVRHSMQVAWRQIHSGRFFCFEHPARATSWSTCEIIEVINHPTVELVVFDQCRVGAKTKIFGNPVRKRTRLLTNHPGIIQSFRGLMCNCTRPHTRLTGMEGGVYRSSYAQVYPPGFVQRLVDAL